MRFTAAEVQAHEAKLAARKSPAVVGTPNTFEKESALHDAILNHCKAQGWIAFHGSMAHKAMRTVGEPDFTILADQGRVFFIECKTATGKLSPEQLGIKMWAEKLGHTIHTCRSVEEFYRIIKPEFTASERAQKQFQASANSSFNQRFDDFGNPMK